MEYLKQRIEFYRRRSFSEKMNVIFEFIRENWKPLLKYSFYLIMPVCLIQTYAMNSFLSVYISALARDGSSGTLISNSMASFFGNYGVWMLCYLIGSAILSGMIYSMMQTYATRDDKLHNITINDFKDSLVRNTWKYIHVMLALLFVFVFAVLWIASLAFITTWSLAFTIPILLIALLLLIPLGLFVPVYIFERDISFSQAFRKAWKLGYATLGGILGLMIVLYIISSVIKTVTMLPWYLMTIVSTVFSITSVTTANQSPIFKFVQYILGLVQSYGSYLSMMIGVIGLAFQYFHAREKVEGVTIESNISNFEYL